MRYFLLLLLTPFLAVAQKPVTLTSPDKRLVFTLRLTEKAPVYQVTLAGRPVLEYSELQLNFAEGGTFGANLAKPSPRFREVNETYDLVVGKTKTVQNHYREAVIPLVEKMAPNRQINLVVRAFDDGVAFRYEFPQQAGWAACTLTDERTTFRLAGDPLLHALFLPDFLTSHEGLYTHLPLSTVNPDTLMDMPALLEVTSGKQPTKTYVGITEAALVDYAGMYLSQRDGVLSSQLAPLPNQPRAGIKVKATLPHRSPWRVLLISDRVGALIESNMLTSLNEPNKLGDVSWLHAGKTTFPWWNGTIIPDTTFAPGNNFETNKYYIDFCADNHIEYHSVVESGLHEWYVNDGAGYMPGPNANPAKAVPGLDMQQVCDYAKSRGVGIRVWVHWKALYPQIDATFAQYEKWGLSGMMIDFMDRDDQEMVKIQEEMLQKAAAHHLHVQFHGAYKPTGLHRTYPNELTREGTLNYETNKWSGLDTPDHDITFPFTRMLAGATDMHLGGFRAVPDSKFKLQQTRPLMHGTRCHQLAMYVVFESYLAMVADYPDAYRNQPGFEFLQQVPTSWDETRVLNAEVGQYITLARRKGTDWYIGTITNSTARTLPIDLSFLPEGQYTTDLYTDSPDVAEQPNHLTKVSRTLSRTDTLSLPIAAGGGMVMRLQKRQ